MPESVREWGLGIAIVGTAALFDPLKRRIQGWVDKAFDRHRYDYRKALVEFGRGLSSETDLDALLESIVERLPRTLLVARVAVFLPRCRAACGWPLRTGLPHERKRCNRQRTTAWDRLARPGIHRLRSRPGPHPYLP